MKNACPDRRELQRLLTGDLESPRRGEIDGHIEACDDCQATLDALTDASTLDIPALARRGERGSHDPTTARLMARLQEDPPIEALSDDPPALLDEVVEFPGAPSSRAPLGTLGRYDILERVGGGATGLVYKARDTKLDRVVAIKVLRGALAARPNARKRLEREARAAASLNHDHIVTLHQIENDQDFPPYLVMEFVDGESLHDRLTRQPLLPPLEAAMIVEQVASALQAASEQGLVHRDIKPSNILLDRRDGRAKIGDFGLACAVEPTNRLTTEGAIAGTPAYMSPEQIESPTKVDIRSDIYGLGVVLYELLTGDVPFRGVVRMTLNQVLHDEPQPPRRLNDTIPRDLETICLKAMSKEPSRRYATPNAFADDLRRWRAHEPIHARPISPAGRLWRWCKRSPRVAALSAAVAALLLAVAGVSVFSAVRLAAARDDAQAAEQESTKNAEAAARQRDVALQTLNALIFQVHEELEREDVVLEDAQEKLLRVSLEGLQRVAETPDAPGSIEYGVAEARSRLGAVLARLDKPDEALEQLTTSRQQAERMLRKTPDATNAAKLNRLLAEIDLQIGGVAMLREDFDAAQSAFEKSRDAYRALHAASPGDDDLTKDFASALFNLGEANFYADRDLDAVAHYRESLQLLDALAATPHGDAAPDENALLAERTNCRLRYGLALYHANDYERATNQLLEVVAAAESHAKSSGEGRRAEDAGDAFIAGQRIEQLLRCAVIAHRHLGGMDAEQGRPDDARAHFFAALKDGAELIERVPWDETNTALQLSVHEDLITLASGASDDAETERVRAAYIAFLNEIVSLQPDNRVANAALADNAVANAIDALLSGATEDARDRFMEASRIASRLFDADTRDLDVVETLVQAYVGLARVAEAADEPQNARDWLAKAENVVRAVEDAADKPQNTEMLSDFLSAQRLFLSDVADELNASATPVR